MDKIIDIRQSPIWENYLSLLGWHIEKIDNVNVFIKKLPLGLSVVKIQRPSLPLDIEKIDKSIKKFHPILLKVEPNNDPLFSQKDSEYLKKYKMFFDEWILLPTKTIKVNLKKPLNEILNSFEKETRYAIRKGQVAEVEIKESSDINLFIKLLKQNAKNKKFVFGKKELQTLFNATPRNHILLIATQKNVPLAGALFVWYQTVGYYMYAASTPLGNKLSSPSLLVWTGIQKLKEKGCEILDLEGIIDERYKQTKSWQGFTNFKMGFSGEITKYPGSFIKFYNPLIRLIFRTFSL